MSDFLDNFDWIDWGTVGSIVLGALLSLTGAFLVNRAELTRKQRIRIHLELLPPMLDEIVQHQLAAESERPYIIVNSTLDDQAIVLHRESFLAGSRDRSFAEKIVDLASRIEDITIQAETVGEHRRVTPLRVPLLDQLHDTVEAYARFLERKIR